MVVLSPLRKRAMNTLITIGTSAGGVEALIQVVAGLPRDLPAQVLIVMHVGAHDSILPQLLTKHGSLPVRHATDGEDLDGAAILVAPPDHHLMVERDGARARARLSRGPKENHSRPSIDVLFRSAAEHFGARTVGVVLTGFLDDGTVGLHAIATCGGTTVVQDPATAVAPSMPQSALDAVRVDHVLPLAQIGPHLARLAGGRTPAPTLPLPSPAPEWVSVENSAVKQLAGIDVLERIATRSSITCPDCGGTLFELNHFPFLRYRCHTGHAFALHTLLHEQETKLEEALWAAMRALQEKEHVVEQLAYRAHAVGDEATAARHRMQAARARDQARALREMVRDSRSGETE